MVNWDDAAQKQLLLTVIHLQNVPTPKWDNVAKMMGSGYTASAVKQQFAKMKRECKEAFGDMTVEGDGAKTPVKGRTGKKAVGEETGKTSTGKRKANRALSNDLDDDEATPSKKTKTEIKDEPKIEDDDLL